jgi:hypothetical protein
MNKVYLSGKMSGLPNLGYELFDKNRDFLLNFGYEVISPADIDRSIGINPDDPFNEERYQENIKRDYAALLECDSIAFLNNWTDSRGAKLESEFANVLKLDRYRVDADNLYFEKELVIGLSGYAGVGKNTIAEEFVRNDRFEQRGFADALKEILYELNPTINVDLPHDRLQDIVDTFGWEKAKKIPEIRQLLQRLGDGCRKSLGEDIFINTLFNQPHKANLIISDLRYENEALEIRRRGGYVIRVERPGIGPVNSHSSEKLDFEADFTVSNNKSPADAYLEIKEFLIHQGEFLLSKHLLYK